ncbi:MAG TPA: monofunctional biosynthetic peptidoglycan transglycosylase [Ferruginibacter sp.]|nr:monofunctional biosynthetic peptidoglycan transglycosylase [Ferruginibacter sp.]
MKRTWRILKKIFFWVFIAHITWFLVFIVQKFSVTDFPVTNLKTKMLIVLAVVLVVGLLYFFWLRKIGHVKKAAVILKEIFFIAYISSTLYLLLGIVFNPPITLTQVGSLMQGYGVHRDYISYGDMGPNIKLAVIASEDQLFPDHDGFDIKAIKKAIKYNTRHPNKVRGASTLSQQVAKNVFLFQGGGFLRKGLEVFFTFSIEGLWTKRTILERYLNVAEMGPGIFGVQAAARTYFNKDAKDLTMSEAAQIAACLPNPKRLTVKPLSRYVAGRSGGIVRQMYNLAGDPDVQEIIR